MSLVHMVHRVNFTQNDYLCSVMEGAISTAVKVTHSMEDKNHPIRPVLTIVSNGDVEFDEMEWKYRLSEVIHRIPNDRTINLVINNVQLSENASIEKCGGPIVKSINNVWHDRKIIEPPFAFLTIFIGFKAKKEDYELLEKMRGVTVIYTPEKKRNTV